MKPANLLLVVAGKAIEEVAASHGDFDAWFTQAFGRHARLTACHAHTGEVLPAPQDFDGVIITGSPASATQWEAWMDPVAELVRSCAEKETPLLGVCFGHQIMALALGGRVAPNPSGREMGTVDVVLTKDGSTDGLLGPMMPSFKIQATHVDSVVEPPPQAAVLARTAQENCAAMRIGHNLYGVQFHPEMTPVVMRRYISARAKLIDAERGPGTANRLHSLVLDTRSGEALLARFVTAVVQPHSQGDRRKGSQRAARPKPARAHTLYEEHLAVAGDGLPIFYNEVGKGSPTLMCLDGVGCDQYAFKYVVEGLKERHHIIRWNYAGHGRSPAPRGWPHTPSVRLTVPGLADDAVRVLDDAGVEKAVLCGHSLGVQVALETWHRHPGRVAALVLMCGSHGRPLQTFHNNDNLERALPFIRRLMALMPAVTRAVWRRVLPTELAFQVALSTEVSRLLVKRQDFMPYLLHMAATVDPRLFFEAVGHANAHSAESYLAAVNVPTLVVAAEKDTFTPPAQSRHLHASIPGAQLLNIPAATHAAPIELPELITLRLEKFLDNTVTARSVGSRRRSDRPSAVRHDNGTPAAV